MSARSSTIKRRNSDSTSLNALAIAERSAWEVGSASDVGSDDEAKAGRGVGGIKSMDGERGGLLFDSEEQEEQERGGKGDASARVEIEKGGYDKVEATGQEDGRSGGGGEEEDDPFGDFEHVPPHRKGAGEGHLGG
jgi:hypothetical protein